jgi:2-dehydropantoate 2-reductase
VRVVVYGAGAVGSLFAALLARARVEVVVVASPQHARAIQEDGIQLEGSVEGTWKVTAVEDLAGPFAAEMVLLTVKSFDLDRATRRLASVLARPAPILLPQNGLGIEAIVRNAFKESAEGRTTSPLVRAVNTLPATFVSPGRVRYAGSGEIRLPEPRGEEADDRAIRGFYALFERAGLPVRYVRDFDNALWTKAVVNAAINPLTAAFSVRNGALSAPPYRALAETLIEEGVQAARAAGHALDPTAVREELWRTVEATAANRSSMLQDVDRGRPTEIDVISGALYNAGRARGLAMPETARIIEKVRSRVASAGQRS